MLANLFVTQAIRYVSSVWRAGAGHGWNVAWLSFGIRDKSFYQRCVCLLLALFCIEAYLYDRKKLDAVNRGLFSEDSGAKLRNGNLKRN